MDDEQYIRREFAKALDGTSPGDMLTLKVNGDNGSTRWLSVTPRQARAVCELLATDNMHRVAAALDGTIF